MTSHDFPANCSLEFWDPALSWTSSLNSSQAASLFVVYVFCQGSTAGAHFSRLFRCPPTSVRAAVINTCHLDPVKGQYLPKCQRLSATGWACHTKTRPWIAAFTGGWSTYLVHSMVFPMSSAVQKNWKTIEDPRSKVVSLVVSSHGKLAEHCRYAHKKNRGQNSMLPSEISHLCFKSASPAADFFTGKHPLLKWMHHFFDTLW